MIHLAYWVDRSHLQRAMLLRGRVQDDNNDGLGVASMCQLVLLSRYGRFPPALSRTCPIRGALSCLQLSWLPDEWFASFQEVGQSPEQAGRTATCRLLVGR